MENYAESALFLRVFCGQVADCTGRAFILQLHAPIGWREKRGQSLLDGPFGFFFPSGDVGCTPPKDVTRGFDILLDRESKDGLAIKLNGPWITLAFSESVCTESEMLESLMAVKTECMSEAAKRSLYNAICVLAGHLMCEDVVAQYEVALRKMLSLE